MRFIYACDIHGDDKKYNKLLEVCKKEKINNLVLGGDLILKKCDREKEQPIYLKNKLEPFFHRLKENNINCICILGNDDLELLDLTEFKCYPTSIAYFAYQSKKLVTILGAMDLSKCTTVTLAFTSANALKDIEFVPNSIKISIGFNDSNLLSAISIQSITDGLADLTGGTAQTLTLHATVGGNLTDEQKASITAKNWTLVY